MKTSFDNIEVVNRVIEDFNTKESSIKHLLLNTYDDVGDTIRVSYKDNSLTFTLSNDSFKSDELEKTLNNIGKSVNHNKIHKQGRYGFGTLSYLNICEEVMIEGDGRKFEITENGYSSENIETDETKIHLNNEHFGYYNKESLIRSIRDYLQMVGIDVKTDLFDDKWCTNHTKIGDKIDEDKYIDGFRIVVDNEYYFAVAHTYPDHPTPRIYLNNVPLTYIKEECLNTDYFTGEIKFSIYLKTDKYINKDNIITADISPSNLKIKNYEELIEHVRNKLKQNMNFEKEPYTTIGECYSEDDLPYLVPDQDRIVYDVPDSSVIISPNNIFEKFDNIKYCYADFSSIYINSIYINSVYILYVPLKQGGYYTYYIK